jgi:hypothetical protein
MMLLETRVSKELMMRDGLRRKMFLLRLPVILVIRRAIRVMLARRV